MKIERYQNLDVCTSLRAHQATPWLKLNEIVIDKRRFDDPPHAAKGTGGGSRVRDRF